MTISIEWSELRGSNHVSDEDYIAVQVKENAVEPSQIEIKLLLGPGVKWWKGLQASDIVLCQCQSPQHFSAGLMDYDTFKSKSFTFWKAKDFGVHRPMYTIENQNEHMKGGCSYLFEWIKD